MAPRKSTGTKTRSKTGSVSAPGKQGNRAPANSRSQPGTGKKPRSWPILFWLGFAILTLGIFLINREAISSSIKTIQNEIAGRSEQATAVPLADPNTDTEVQVSPPPTPSPPAVPPSQAPQTPLPQPPASQPVARPLSQTAPASPRTAGPQAAPSGQPGTALQPASQESPRVSPPNNQSQAGQSEMRERSLYFIHVDRDGSILREKVIRKIPVSDSPMMDSIQALISGPNTEERGKGLVSLIPPAARILSATVRGDTAYISFSEDFQYNTYGVEGYAAQLRQIIFTATEFSNVKNVQILIEGRRIDYLGEGIWIGSPLNRDML